MTKKINKYIYWTPRILAIIFILFLALFSLDVISPEFTLLQIAVGLFMHNIPVFILLAVLLISWKYEIVGGVVFILAGVLYTAMILMNGLRHPPDGFVLMSLLIIAGPAFLIGILFMTNWFQKDKPKKASKK